MDSIFPFLDEEYLLEDDELNEEVFEAVEWAWNFKANEFKTDRNNEMYLVFKDEAIKIWIWKLLKTDRFRYLIYEHDYGSELSTIVGETGTKAYMESEIKRIVEETILSSLDKYVLEINNIQIIFDSDVVHISFSVKTIYEGVDIDGIQVF